MIDPSVLASVPTHLLNDPEIYRKGMLLFRQGQPGIVAHLVEGGGLAKAIGAMGTAANTTANPANAAVSAVTGAVQIAQNEQIKSGIAALRTLQLQNLALSGVGIGVSIISHQLTMRKLGAIENKIDSFGSQLDKLAREVAELRQDRVRQDLTDLGAYTLRAEDAWSLADPRAEWQAVAGSLNTLKERFKHRAGESLARGDPMACVLLVDAYAVAANAQISCRIAAGDALVAQQLAGRFADDLTGLLMPHSAASFAAAILARTGSKPGSADYLLALSREMPIAREQAAIWREKQAMASSLPVALTHLLEREIDGHSWMKEAREREDPLLLSMTE